MLEKRQFFMTMMLTQWERAKGELRAVAALAGSNYGKDSPFVYGEIDDEIEKFIKHLEEGGFLE